MDRIREFEVDKRIVGIKNVSLNERYLSRASTAFLLFPDHPLTEAIAQVGAILILAQAGRSGDGRLFAAASSRVRYRRPVRPGDDVVEIEAIVLRLRSLR